jgi:hypothetical protein
LTPTNERGEVGGRLRQINRSSLPNEAKDTLRTILAYVCWRDGTNAWPSVPTLASDMSLGRSAVHARLRFLVQKGILRNDGRSKYNTVVRGIDFGALDKYVAEERKPVKKRQSPKADPPIDRSYSGRPEIDTPVDRSQILRSTVDKHPEEHPLNTPPLGGVLFGQGEDSNPKSAPVPPGFLAWWREYPNARRKGRDKCIQIWKSKGLEARYAELVATLKRHRIDPQWTKEGAKYAPLTTTYLSQGRYDDDADDITHLQPSPPSNPPVTERAIRMLSGETKRTAADAVRRAHPSLAGWTVAQLEQTPPPEFVAELRAMGAIPE